MRPGLVFTLYVIFILEQIQQQLADNSGFGLLVQVMATSKVTFSLSCLHKQIYYLVSMPTDNNQLHTP